MYMYMHTSTFQATSTFQHSVAADSPEHTYLKDSTYLMFLLLVSQIVGYRNYMVALFNSALK